MNIVSNLNQNLFWNEEINYAAHKTAEVTALAAICGYAGTFFFTSFSPNTGALYLASVAVVSAVSYQALEKIKGLSQSLTFKKIVAIVQLLQIPFFFYILPKHLPLCLSRAAELEIIAASAHFAAIPIFFHLAIAAWNEPTVGNIAAATGVLLPLANGLRHYVQPV